MKRFYVLAMVALVALTTQAQMPEAGAQALPYYLPQTVIELSIQVQQTDVQPGPYAKYAERYLGLTDAIQQASTSFAVKKVKIKTCGEADRSQCFQAPVSGAAANVTLNKQGVIKGVNLPEKTCCAAYAGSTEGQGKDGKTAGCTGKGCKAVNLTAPLNENVMLASGEMKIAESAATQIYKLRESRMNLLCGEWDNLPADGKSTEALLKEMKQTEKQLTDLFVGTTKKHTITSTIRVIPGKASMDTVLFRFSAERGMLSSDDLTGHPYRLVVAIKALDATKAGFQGKPALYYRMPATANVRVLDENDEVIAEATCPVSEFGRLVQVPAGLLKTATTLRWDGTTGALREVGSTGLGK